jgi:hypothetical protein
MEFEVQQDDERMEIIAKRIVAQHAPTVFAADMANPSGKTRKAVTTYTTTKDKR